MIKYTIDGGEPFEVDPQNEKQFLIDNPNAKKSKMRERRKAPRPKRRRS